MIKICGIGGLFRYETFSKKEEKEEVSKIMAKLLIGLQLRGDQATGISLINTHEDIIKVYKLPIKASKFVRKSRYWKEFMRNEYNLVLLHTRAPTVGDPRLNENNHPIFDKDNNNVLVHNGGVPNYKELREQYKLKPLGEVDSEVILSMYNHKKGNLIEALKELEGSIAIALYDKNKLYLYRQSSPLEVSYFPERKLWIFSSEEDYIHNAIIKRKDLNIVYNRWKFEDRLDGFMVYSNYSMDNEDLMTITFEKDMGVDVKEHIGNKEKVYSNRDWKNNGCEGLNQLFQGSRKKNDRCKKCAYKYCKDKDTYRADGCKSGITTDDLEYEDDKFMKVKNRGLMKITVFDRDKLDEAGLLGRAKVVDTDIDDELGLQGHRTLGREMPIG